MKKVISKVYKIPIPEKSQPYNFDFFLTHYVFAPWVVEGKELVRLFKLESEKFVLTRVGFKKTPKPILLIKLLPKKILTKEEQNNLVELISWIFAVNDDVKYFYKVICQKDPVLKTASTEIYGAHLRTDPYVLESVIGVIVAQNVYFKRIYEMQRLLCEKFGEIQVFDGKTYYTFPNARKLANSLLSEIRNCKVGYRDKYIKGVAVKLVKEKIDLDDLRKLSDIEKIRQKLIELPGVGPYTADLAIAIGFRLPTFHLDLFTREALQQFYFKGKKVSDEKLKSFAEKRWGKWKHHPMLLLTTNTDTWAKKLGYEFRLKSGAKNN